MHSFAENFNETRQVSWHPRRFTLCDVSAGRVGAWDFPTGFLAAEVGLARLARCVLSCAWAPIVWGGGSRNTASFLFSAFMTLDFDEADYTLAQACDDWGDSVHIIGTTKSHRVEKDGKPAKDRFRVIVPWAEVIRDADAYTYNVERLISRYDADNTCKDAARFFWPCREIISVNQRGFLQPVLPYHAPEQLNVNQAQVMEQLQATYAGGLPVWISKLVHEGKLPEWEINGSRKWACNAAARKLRDIGWAAPDVLSLLRKANFSRKNFDDTEIDAAVKSAFKRKGIR